MQIYVPWNLSDVSSSFQPVHDGGPYHVETSPLICTAISWIGFYLIGTSFMKELM